MRRGAQGRAREEGSGLSLHLALSLSLFPSLSLSPCASLSLLPPLRRDGGRGAARRSVHAHVHVHMHVHFAPRPVWRVRVTARRAHTLRST